MVSIEPTFCEINLIKPANAWFLPGLDMYAGDQKPNQIHKWFTTFQHCKRTANWVADLVAKFDLPDILVERTSLPSYIREAINDDQHRAAAYTRTVFHIPPDPLRRGPSSIHSSGHPHLFFHTSTTDAPTTVPPGESSTGSNVDEASSATNSAWQTAYCVHPPRPLDCWWDFGAFILQQAAATSFPFTCCFCSSTLL